MQNHIEKHESEEVRLAHGARTTGHTIWCEAAVGDCTVHITPQKSKTVIICDQKSTGAARDEGNYTDDGDMHEIKYTNLVEGKIGIGGCVN